MAQLHKTEYKLPPIKYDTSDWREGSREHEEAFAKLQEEHEMVYFGVGDGSACYIVKSRKPLVLQHVDYSDAWHAPYALIRGLRVQDLRECR